MERNQGKPEPKSSHHTDEEQRNPKQNDEDTPEKNLDKTIADSFPASDPPSSIPDPEEEEDAA
jgi:hypothetical protein